jgi:hypothetical protein
VEVHVLSRESNYQSFIVQTPTPFLLADAVNFDYFGGGGNLGIKRANTAGTIELHFLSADYQSFTSQVPTSIPLADAHGLTFLFEAGGRRTPSALLALSHPPSPFLYPPSRLIPHPVSDSRMKILELGPSYNGSVGSYESALLLSDVPHFVFQTV